MKASGRFLRFIDRTFRQLPWGPIVDLQIQLVNKTLVRRVASEVEIYERYPLSILLKNEEDLDRDNLQIRSFQRFTEKSFLNEDGRSVFSEIYRSSPE